MLKTMSNRAAVALLGAAVLSPRLAGRDAAGSLRTGHAGLYSVAGRSISTTAILSCLYVGRGSQQFDAGHVPGSRFVQLDELVEQHKDSLNDLPSVATLAGAVREPGRGR